MTTQRLNWQHSVAELKAQRREFFTTHFYLLKQQASLGEGEQWHTLGVLYTKPPRVKDWEEHPESVTKFLNQVRKHEYDSIFGGSVEAGLQALEAIRNRPHGLYD